MAATANMPSPDQLKAYVEQLPQVYRDVLTAFQACSPERRFGEGVLLGTIDAWVENDSYFRKYEWEELVIALRKMEQQGFFEITNRTRIVTPTRLGEELIATVTGARAREIVVPELPKPTW